jgi:hypothetical protein
MPLAADDAMDFNCDADDANSWNFYAKSLAADDAMDFRCELLTEHMRLPMMHLYEFMPYCHFELTVLCSTLSF